MSANKSFNSPEYEVLVEEILLTPSEINLIAGLLNEKLVIKNSNKILSKSHLYPNLIEYFIMSMNPEDAIYRHYIDVEKYNISNKILTNNNCFIISGKLHHKCKVF